MGERIEHGLSRMDLLTNAVESLRAGVEDYAEGSHGRMLSAVRSIHAGILLLYKEALRRMSPAGSEEVLLKAKVLPRRDSNGSIEFFGEGRKTVDIQQIKERFVGLGIVTDWARFDQMTTVRNDVEHYFTKAAKKTLEGVVSNAFILARNFIATQLAEDPLKLLGPETWEAMLDVSEVYEAERDECLSLLRGINWLSDPLAEGVLVLACDACGGSLLRPEGQTKTYSDEMNLQCRGCGETVNANAFVPRAIAQALASEAYSAAKDGDETPYTFCPECSEETYIMDEQRCAFCGESAEHTCARCGNSIPAEELGSSPYCGWCDHMMSKDD
jgi:hypothetical protein